MGTINLQWDNNNYIADKYYIYRSTAPMNINDLPEVYAVVDKNTNSYFDNNVVDDMDYYYRIAALVTNKLVYNTNEIVVKTGNTVGISDIFNDNSNIATYTFDGNVNDLNGTYNAVMGSTATFDTGVYNQCVATDGTSSGTVTDLHNLNLPDCSVSVWLSVNRAFDYGVLSFETFFTANNDTIEVFDNLSGVGSSKDYETGNYPIDGTFFHYVISISNKIPTIYVNGVNQNVSYLGTSNRNTKQGIGALGRIGSSNYYFAAKYDQLRMFNRPLTDEEVLILYNET